MQAKEPSSTRQEPPFATHTGGGADGDVAPADTVVIVGGGIIGSCSAYFLAKRFLMEEEEEGLRQEAEAAGEKPSEGRPEVSRARGSDTAAAPALVEKAKDPVVVVNQDESDPGRQQTSSVAQSASSLPGLDFVRSDPPLRRRRRRKIIVVERHDVAGCASGKAGGFLARGWGDNDPTRQLHHVSFDLHAALAKELDVQSYRKLVTLEVSNRPRKPRGRRSSDLAKKPRKEGADGGGMQELPTPRASPICPWLNGDKFQANTMDTTTAQVTPFEFTTKILRAARATGFVEVVRSRVVGITEEKSTGLDQDEGADNKASAFYEVQLEGSQKRIRAGAVVVAMGPWSVEVSVCGCVRLVFAHRKLGRQFDVAVAIHNCVGTQAASWFPRMNVPMEGIYSTSIVFRDRPLAATALFCGEDDAGCRLEVYPRLVAKHRRRTLLLLAAWRLLLRSWSFAGSLSSMPVYVQAKRRGLFVRAWWKQAYPGRSINGC